MPGNFTIQQLETIGRREASIAVRSVGTNVVLVLVGAFAVGLCVWMFRSEDKPLDDAVAALTVCLVSFVPLCILTMMNSTMTGGAIVEEKGSKITEFLLSMAKAEELYWGKICGHVVVGLRNVAVLWAAVNIALYVLMPTPPGVYPGLVTVLVLVFMGGGYILFTALYTMMGSLVRKSEDFLIAQMPVLCLLITSLLVPYAPIFGWGSFADGWLAALSYIPPFSIGAAPYTYALGEGSAAQLAFALVLLVAADAAVLWLGGKLYRRCVLN